MNHEDHEEAVPMYSVIARLDGTFEGRCVIQDGTEHAIQSTLGHAIDAVISLAWVLNHARIDESDVVFYREREVTERRVVTEIYEPARPLTWEAYNR